MGKDTWNKDQKKKKEGGIGEEKDNHTNLVQGRSQCLKNKTLNRTRRVILYWLKHKGCSEDPVLDFYEFNITKV